MDESMLITYKASNEHEGFDLGLLGESFSGVNSVLKELADLMNIEGDIEIRTTKITHGSVELHNAIYVTITSLPFNNPQDLYDFLQVASPEMYQEAREFFSATLGVHRDLNSYFASHAFDAVVIAELAKIYITKVWKWAGKQKTRLTISDRELGEISSTTASRLANMVKRGKFRRVLKPMTSGNVRSIKVSVSQNLDTISTTITESDIENYLPEEDQILPQFLNGTVHTFTGTLQNLQSARGEIIKIKVNNIERRFSLITARPHDGQTTEDYLPFYHQGVTFTAEVVRSSMYKRPEFVVIEMDINQQELLDSDTADS